MDAEIAIDEDDRDEKSEDDKDEDEGDQNMCDKDNKEVWARFIV